MQKHLLKRVFSTTATRSSFAAAQHHMHNRADLGEFPELDRSFMKVLESNIDTGSADYQDNYKLMLKQNEDLERITKEFALDVDKEYREKALKRDKLLPRERINAILDHGSPFLELS